MSKDEYYVEPDGDGDLTLWSDDQAIVSILSSDVLYTSADASTRHDRAVWRAAVSVLVDDEETVEAVAKTMKAEAGGWAWDAMSEAHQAAWIQQARAAIAALRQRAVSE